jgi:hypothetical protein
MSHKTSKGHSRRQREGYFDRIVVGRGIDIGCGDDPMTLQALRHPQRAEGRLRRLPLPPRRLARPQRLRSHRLAGRAPPQRAGVDRAFMG